MAKEQMMLSVATVSYYDVLMAFLFQFRGHC
jgi:hypothetical protein